MDSTYVNFGPLLRYLFQNENKIYKELDAYFRQDGSLFISHQLSLSPEAYISLKEKLLTYPQEAACILHQLAVTIRQIRTRKDTQDKPSTVERASSHREYQVSNIPEDFSQLNRIFIECLDHCLRRIKNLDEKLHKEREEYSEVLKRQQKSYSPTRSNLGIAKQEILESKEAFKLRERTVTTNMEKLRNETLFYRIFSLTGDVGVIAMNELFPRMLRLLLKKFISCK